MHRLITPKQLADAIGVSESSLKRWADAGKIDVSRTDGGHRRIAITEAVRFIRDTKSAVVRPDLLGLPSNENTIDAALTSLLTSGDAKSAVAAVVARFLAGHSIAAICDGPLRAALSHMGNVWRHTEDGIMVEHRATAIVIDLLGTLKTLVSVPDDAPSAVGGAPSSDPYTVPSMMCGVALAEIGTRAVNLGAETPLESLRQAMVAEKASLVWLSLSTNPSNEVVRGMPKFIADVIAYGATLVIGGRHRESVDSVPPSMVNQVRSAGTIGELIAIAEDCRLVKRRASVG
jgi:MerR family transcriptional regulator, light-induced transcriptional regulator